MIKKYRKSTIQFFSDALTVDQILKLNKLGHHDSAFKELEKYIDLRYQTKLDNLKIRLCGQ